MVDLVWVGFWVGCVGVCISRISVGYVCFGVVCDMGATLVLDLVWVVVLGLRFGHLGFGWCCSGWVLGFGLGDLLLGGV